MHMNKSIYFAVVVIIVLVIAGIYFGKGSNSSSGEIKLGSILILSGDGASWGEASKNGIDMAVEDLNKNGGILGKKVTIAHEDNQSQPKLAVGLFQKLTDSGVNYIIGPNWSNSGLPLIDLAKSKRTVIVSPSLGLKEFNEGNEYLFNTWPHDTLLSEKLADYVYCTGKRNVVVFGLQDVWNNAQTKAFSERFIALGGTIATTYEPVSTDTDARGEIAKLKNLPNVDAIVMTNSGFNQFSIMARQLRELGVKVPFYSITVDSKLIADCGSACENLIYLTFLTPSNAFEARYKETYGREVEIGADSAYDAVMLIAKAMEETKSTDTTVVAKYMAGIKEYDGASGHIVSDGKRGFTKDYKVIQVVNGVPTEISR